MGFGYPQFFRQQPDAQGFLQVVFNIFHASGYWAGERILSADRLHPGCIVPEHHVVQREDLVDCAAFFHLPDLSALKGESNEPSKNNS